MAEKEGQMPEERLTAAEWLEVRGYVAGCVKDAHPRMEPSTSTKIAEALLGAGLIDVAQARCDLDEIAAETVID